MKQIIGGLVLAGLLFMGRSNSALACDSIEGDILGSNGALYQGTVFVSFVDMGLIQRAGTDAAVATSLQNNPKQIVLGFQTLEKDGTFTFTKAGHSGDVRVAMSFTRASNQTTSPKSASDIRSLTGTPGVCGEKITVTFNGLQGLLQMPTVSMIDAHPAAF